MAEKKTGVGRVVKIIGPVLDIQFEEGQLPAIYNAVRVTSEGYNLPEPLDVTAEVQQHLGEGRVRAVAMPLSAAISMLASLMESPLALPFTVT